MPQPVTPLPIQDDKQAALIALLHDALKFVDERQRDALQNLPPSSALSELGIDSLSLSAMAGYIEDRLGIVLHDEELADVRTVRDFVELIGTAQANAGST